MSEPDTAACDHARTDEGICVHWWCRMYATTSPDDAREADLRQSEVVGAVTRGRDVSLLMRLPSGNVVRVVGKVEPW